MNYVTEYDIGVNKPHIPKKIHDNWQKILDSLATIADVPSALIMHVLPDKIEVANSSKTRPLDNPYEVNASEHLGCGLYCETVMKEKAELHVKNALKDDDWKDNPDVAIDMISYYGLPLLWPDETVFGTMCILDKKDLDPSDLIKKLMGVFRKAVENELEILEQHHLQKELLKNEVYRQTKQINTQNTKLIELNENLEERVKDEVEKNKKQQVIMFNQSRLAQIGQIISMLAHQWRQPLATISMDANNILLDIALDTLDEKNLKNTHENIVNTSQDLSNTINNFRNFYASNENTVTEKIDDTISKALNIIKQSLIDYNIEIIEEYSSIEEIELYDKEIMQVILNILKNSQDNFKVKDTKKPYIKISTKNNTISICDNGGGISEDVIDEIFDPYFSTKDEKNATGLGLYMVKMIIEEHHNGKVVAKNTDEGVCFTIEFAVISEK